MGRGSGLFLHGGPSGRHSITALMGALEERGLDTCPETGFALGAFEVTPELRRFISSHDPCAVGISFMTHEKRQAFSFVSRLRHEFGPQLFIFCGGPHPTGAPRETLNRGFDMAVRGDGEAPLILVAQALRDRQAIAAIPGSCVREGDRMTAFPPAVSSLDDFAPYAPGHRLYNALEITRGCFHHCAYCQTPSLFEGPVRHRSLEKIIEALTLYIRQRNRPAHVRFITPSAFSYGAQTSGEVRFDRIEELLRESRKVLRKEDRLGFGFFPSELRPEQATEEAFDLILELADNRRLVMGAQTGNAQRLASLHRGHTLDHVLRAVRLGVKKGFRMDVDFILGFPHETEEEFRDTLAFMEEIGGAGAAIHAHFFLPLPGTPLGKESPVPLTEEKRSALKKIMARFPFYGNWERQAEISESLKSAEGHACERPCEIPQDTVHFHHTEGEL